MYDQLRNEFDNIKKSYGRDVQEIVTLYADEGVLSEPDKEYMERHPEKQYVILERRQLEEL